MEFLLKTFIDIFITVLGGIMFALGCKERDKTIKILIMSGGIFLIRIAPCFVSWSMEVNK